MGTLTFSQSPRIILGSDNQHLVSAVTTSLVKAGFDVETATNYGHLEELWHKVRHDVVLFEVSHSDSIEPAIESAIRIKRQDAQQFIAYLADANLHASGLTGDAILSRDTSRLPQALREALDGRL